MGFHEENGVTLRAVSKDWQIFFLDNVNDQEDILITIKGEIMKKNYEAVREIWILISWH